MALDTDVMKRTDHSHFLFTCVVLEAPNKEPIIPRLGILQLLLPRAFFTRIFFMTR